MNCCHNFCCYCWYDVRDIEAPELPDTGWPAARRLRTQHHVRPSIRPPAG